MHPFPTLWKHQNGKGLIFSDSLERVQNFWNYDEKKFTLDMGVRAYDKNVLTEHPVISILRRYFFCINFFED